MGFGSARSQTVTRSELPPSVVDTTPTIVIISIGKGRNHPRGCENYSAMKDLRNILQRDRFLKTLFESIPCGVLVVNEEGYVQAVNNVLERTFGTDRVKLISKRPGDVLRCVHATEGAGCGYGESCRICRVRKTALKALAGTQIHRNRAEVEIRSREGVRNLVLLISAAPVQFEGEKYAIVIIEDITELNHLRRRLKEEQSFAGIIGRDAKMQELFETIREVAQANVPVLIQGESGTGKELVAAAIHNESPRADKQFVPVNCGALPDGLLESELFGHVKGAFTGAIRDKKGRFELADGGTIFLDEVGDLSPAMQVKLLRVLQEGTFEPVGSEKTIKVDVRVISATNKDLRQEMKAKRFREDLFYRLCVVPITLPPLRERRNDIPLLVEHFLRRACEQSGRQVPMVSDEAISILMDYDWPGNVRELQNALQFALIKCRGDIILPDHLPPTVTQGRSVETPIRARRRKLDIQTVSEALKKTNGNKVRAAKLLGVSRATLYRFLTSQEENAT